MNKIHLTNIENDEVFTYSTILIKGFIDFDDVDSNLTLKHYSNNGKQLAESRWAVYKSQFKVMIELKIGDNSLVFKFGDEIVRTKLVYNKRITEYTVCPVYVICADHDGRFQVILRIFKLHAVNTHLLLFIVNMTYIVCVIIILPFEV